MSKTTHNKIEPFAKPGVTRGLLSDNCVIIFDLGNVFGVRCRLDYDELVANVEDTKYDSDNQESEIAIEVLDGPSV